ncbi:hypothetical protein D3797_005815 [Bacillus subtilis]|nr:hypothetical protein DKG76_16095 [Bacillus inaquosorum]RKQ25586.1 hypothetical protein D3797_005815 [Bacillus subtilis]
MPKSLSIYTNILSQKRPYDILWKTSRTDWIFQKNGLVVAYFFGIQKKSRTSFNKTSGLSFLDLSQVSFQHPVMFFNILMDRKKHVPCCFVTDFIS